MMKRSYIQKEKVSLISQEIFCSIHTKANLICNAVCDFRNNENEYNILAENDKFLTVNKTSNRNVLSIN